MRDAPHSEDYYTPDCPPDIDNIEFKEASKWTLFKAKLFGRRLTNYSDGVEAYEYKGAICFVKLPDGPIKF